MKHYIPWPTENGYVVAYINHRGELVGVMECNTLQSAYHEAASMTAASIAQTAPTSWTYAPGNRYLRRFS